MFLRKGVLKTCSKYTEEHPCQSVISIKLQSNFIGIILRHGYSPVNLLHIFRTRFTKNTSGWLLLSIGWQTFHMWVSSYWCLKFTKISEPQKLNSLILPEVKGLGNILARKFLVKYLIVLYLYQFCYQFIWFRFLETTT